MPRLFTALELPERVAGQMALARGGVVGARWLQAGDYHVTLRFIGDVDGRAAHDIVETLGDIRRPKASVRFEGLSWFGGDKPRAIVARVKADPALMDLQAEQERRLRRIGARARGPQIYAPCDAGAAARGGPGGGRRLSRRSRRASSGSVHRRSLRALFGPRRDGRRTLCGRGRVSAGVGVSRNEFQMRRIRIKIRRNEIQIRRNKIKGRRNKIKMHFVAGDSAISDAYVPIGLWRAWTPRPLLKQAIRLGSTQKSGPRGQWPE